MADQAAPDHGGSEAGHGTAGHGGHDAAAHGGHGADFARRFWVSLALTVPVILISPMPLEFFGLPHVQFAGDTWVLFALATVIYLYGGWPFLTGMIAELRNRSPGMMTLVAVGITTAYAYSAAVAFGIEGEPVYWELATLVDVMLLGHWIEMRSVMGTSGALEAIARLVPGEAHRVAADGSTHDVPTVELVPGDRVLVKPGERVPADGCIVEGASSLDESLLTGESRPVRRQSGDSVVGGAVNGSGSLLVDVERTGEATFVAQVLDLVRRAQESRSRTQRLADRAARWLTAIALGAGLLTLLVWLALGEPAFFAIERAVSVIVIACPHALGLAIPLVVAVSTGLAASAGVLIRERSGFEDAHRVDTVVFDKTGTLTEGRFGVTDVVTIDGFSDARLLGAAAAVERLSEHPVATAIVDAARAGGDVRPTVSEFEALPGVGVRGVVDGTLVEVIAPRAVEERGLVVPTRLGASPERPAATTAVVLADGAPIGTITLADAPKPSAARAVERLRELGIRSVMLTGDGAAVAEAVARAVGIEDVIAGVVPQDKAVEIRRLRDSGRVVAMTGDGVNDAPALAEADVGIAIGAGTDVAIQIADVVLVRSDPHDVVDVIELSRATWRKMRQNLWWATGYNVVAIPLAAGILAPWGIWLSPAAGAALMALSTVIVAVNARTLHYARH